MRSVCSAAVQTRVETKGSAAAVSGSVPSVQSNRARLNGSIGMGRPLRIFRRSALLSH